jgi:hypothetical protein
MKRRRIKGEQCPRPEKIRPCDQLFIRNNRAMASTLADMNV